MTIFTASKKRKCDSMDSVLNATSNWLAFDKAFEKNKTCWTKNQYADEWSSKIVNQNLEKIIFGSKDQLKTTLKELQKTRIDP